MENTATHALPSLASMLQTSCSNAERAVKGLDETVSSLSPDNGGWSITFVVEHLAVMEERIQAMLRNRLFTEGMPTEHQADDAQNTALIKSIESRSNRVNAPGVVCPEGRYQSCREAIDAFQVLRSGTIAYAQDPPSDLRAFGLPHPIFGMLSGYQWVLAIAAHTNRHVNQIEEIKRAVLGR